MALASSLLNVAVSHKGNLLERLCLPEPLLRMSVFAAATGRTHNGRWHIASVNIKGNINRNVAASATKTTRSYSSVSIFLREGRKLFQRITTVHWRKQPPKITFNKKHQCNKIWNEDESESKIHLSQEDYGNLHVLSWTDCIYHSTGEGRLEMYIIATMSAMVSYPFLTNAEFNPWSCQDWMANMTLLLLHSRCIDKLLLSQLRPKSVREGSYS